jgi:hypothetical protein
MTPPKTRIGRRPICPGRVRSIAGSGFSFVPNRFLHDGFFAALNVDELVLYFALVVAGDRNGLSFYHYDSLCSLLGMTVDRYVAARNALIDADLIAFDGTRFQVLSLPAGVTQQTEPPLRSPPAFEEHDPATIGLLIKDSLRGVEE